MSGSAMVLISPLARLANDDSLAETLKGMIRGHRFCGR